MKVKLLFINAAGSVIQSIGLSIILFVLYRWLLETMGPERLGIWSLVIATTSVAGVGKLGLTGSVLKFTAKYVALGDFKRAAGIIETSFVSVSLFMGAILGLLHYWGLRIIGRVVEPKFAAEAVSILPPVITAFYLIMVTEILFSALDGLERIYLKNIIILLTALLNLLLCFLLVPVHGLPGAAYARGVSNLCAFISAYLILNARLPGVTLFLFRWDPEIFREIRCYGMNFQLISLIRMALDPVTKGLMSHFGDLAMVGYYEMANRLVLQVRSVMVSANHAVIPVVSGIADRDPEQVKRIYLDNYALFIYICMPVYTALIIVSPLVSRVWLGSCEPVFIRLVMLLTAAWALNSINVPAYYSFIGIGRLSFNLLSGVVTAALNIGLGYLLGALFGGPGVAAGWALALVFGSSVVYISYHRVYGIDFRELLPSPIALPVGLCALVSVGAFMLYRRDFGMGPWEMEVLGFAFTGLSILSFSTWFNPFRKTITDRLRVRVRGGMR